MFHVQSLNIWPFDQIKWLKNMVGLLNLLIIDIDFTICFLEIDILKNKMQGTKH